MPISTAAAIDLTDEERAVLESWVRRPTSAQAAAVTIQVGSGLRERPTAASTRFTSRGGLPMFADYDEIVEPARAGSILDPPECDARARA